MDPCAAEIAAATVATERPATTDALGEQVRAAAAAGHAVLPLGGQTQLGLGLPPQRPGVAIDLTGLDRVIDYPARDMTITVEAGITIAALRRLLATEQQRLPIDVPAAERATLGGVLATNTSGPRRLGHGTLRDYVIGITTINDEGQPTKAGGRVVKNVAGYDLCKLHIGALGTLGIISQATLKVRPLPETAAVVLLGCEPASLPTLLDRLHDSRTQPVCIEVLNAGSVRELAATSGGTLPDTPWLVAVGFEETSANVGWQVQQLVRETAEAGVSCVEARAGAASAPLFDGLAELTACASSLLSFKASMLSSAVADFARRAADGGALVQAHAGSGVVRGHLVGDWPLERAAPLLRDLLPAAVAARGNLIVPRCPPAWKRTVPVWGQPRGDWPLMRKVKERLDPHNLFNPGRYIDGV